MKYLKLDRMAFAALVAVASLGAHAQSSARAVSSDAPAMSAKDAKAADRKLRKDVVRVLARTKGLVAAGITVRAKDGAVILEGGVPEASQMTLAARAAEGVPGVKSVKNMLTMSQF
ncbi:transport-associated protein [Caballeronia hypogeia]|uniref:Transport-associated protein n=1 Tax=Caballeronia hypogeia TaxID=1777140 RepID=A0A158A247_9BURK|nr:BON domain-containing protein [Caballeronia hypogeia]SAK51825.1 transport-associated protein [Caballeronia hypogeia]